VKVVGNGFSLPESVTIDASGNVFVADTANNAVKEIQAASGYTAGQWLPASSEDLCLSASTQSYLLTWYSN
jgi:hypothetical protein